MFAARENHSSLVVINYSEEDVEGREMLRKVEFI